MWNKLEDSDDDDDDDGGDSDMTCSSSPLNLDILCCRRGCTILLSDGDDGCCDSLSRTPTSDGVDPDGANNVC